ncbi:hypothetical protein RAMDARK_1959 [Rickettsia amblyommatis str. Darkwater]|nr:hypothetical protein RAMDARK_1959 [Rickettsia amblyommatis str. Darkwater]
MPVQPSPYDIWAANEVVSLIKRSISTIRRNKKYKVRLFN